MPTNWIAPTGSDLLKVLSSLVIKDSNESTDPEAASGQPVGEGDPQRRDDKVSLVVDQVRGAIRTANRFPLAVTAKTVPPEAVNHALILAAYELAGSTPSLKLVLVTEAGAMSPFKTLYEKAQAYLTALRTGAGVTEPTDPTGRDYETAVQDDELLPDYNPSIQGTAAGEVVGPVDLSTE